MFDGSDLGLNFFNRVYACGHYLTSRRIIFGKSNAAREKDLIFCDGCDNALISESASKTCPLES
jgi:hypothetical protein